MDNYYDNIKEIIELSPKDFTNNKITNKKIKGHYGLLKAYAPWCGHCHRFQDSMIFLAKGLQKHGFRVCALNCDVKENATIAQGLLPLGDSLYFPTLFKIYPNGSIEKMNIPNREMDTLLDTICNFTNKKKCCKKVNNKLVCSRKKTVKNNSSKR